MNEAQARAEICRVGKSLFERWRLGSISKRVTAYAHCAVVIVR